VNWPKAADSMLWWPAWCGAVRGHAPVVITAPSAAPIGDRVASVVWVRWREHVEDVRGAPGKERRSQGSPLRGATSR
jgi:hypothetical protein